MNYDNLLSDKIKKIKPSGIRRFFDIAAESKDAITLGVGEPDFDTPWTARSAAIKSIQKGYTQYTSNSGLLELRQLIVRYLDERYSLKYDAREEIVVTVGASEAIDLALRVLINEGDEVLVPEPSYVSYTPCIHMCGGRPVPIKCTDKDSFMVMPDSLIKSITPRTKVLILPYPNNPTGAIMDREALQNIAKIIIENNIIVISDEIYSELTYDAKHVSIAEIEGMRKRTIVINGFSKAFAMTGWRLGYLAAPAPLARAMLKLHQYVIMCAPTAAQYAACAVLEEGFSDDFAAVEEMRAEYDRRRRFLVDAFNNMGLSCNTPRGAFYVFPCVADTGMDGTEFAEKLLVSHGVAVVPGEGFGESGKYFIRCSYAYSMKTLAKATERISAFLDSLKK